MTEKAGEYTDSALADLFADFFKRTANKSKYVNIINNAATTPHYIKIDFDDLTEELQEAIKNNKEAMIHTAISWAIQAVFQISHGYSLMKHLTEETNVLSFELINAGPRWDGRTFKNPVKQQEDKDRFTGKHKIDNVADEIQKDRIFCTFPDNEQILMWNGKIYDDVHATSIIKKETENLIINCTTPNRTEVINKLKVRTYIDRELFDVDPSLITVENGILDLDTLQTVKHTPDHLSRVLIPRNFIKPKYEINEKTIFTDVAKNLRDTLFWKFLTTSMTVNGVLQKQDLETLLEMLAAPLIKKQIDAKGCMNLGTGENGKTIFVDYIQHLYGGANGTDLSLHDIAADTYMPAELDGKLYNIAPDLEKYELFHSGKLKAILSGDAIYAQKKNKDPFKMTVFATLFFNANGFPKTYDQSRAFFRRWIIIQWNRNFEIGSPDRDATLKDRIYTDKEEMDRVFSCIVYLARRLNKTGEFTHNKDWQQIQKTWNEHSNPLKMFDKEWIISSPGSYKTKREVYEFYEQKMLAAGETPLSITRFGNEFAQFHKQDSREYDPNTGIQERVWPDITFREPKQTTLKTADSS